MILALPAHVHVFLSQSDAGLRAYAFIILVYGFGYVNRSDPEVIQLFSNSTHLSMIFQTLIKRKMLKNNDLSCYKTFRYGIYHADKC